MKVLFPSSELKQQVRTFPLKKKNKKNFSIKRGAAFFLESNLFVLLILAILLINKNYWDEDGSTMVIAFISGFELLFMLLFVPACFFYEPVSIKRVIQSTFKKREKNEWIGMALAFCVITLISLGFIFDIPYPSIYLPLLLTFSWICAFVSIFIQRFVIAYYYFNVNVENGQKSIFSYLFKYLALFIMGFNHYIQLLLSKMPFLLNKLFAIFTFLLLFVQFFIVLMIYGE
jgi:succinate dehydrogenase hydrophobic anchor subunit